MTIKQFIQKYYFLSNKDAEFTVDTILDMTDEYLTIIYSGVTHTKESIVKDGTIFLQGMFFSAVFDQNNNTESSFDQFIIQNYREIINKFSVRHLGENAPIFEE